MKVKIKTWEQLGVEFDLNEFNKQINYTLPAGDVINVKKIDGVFKWIENDTLKGIIPDDVIKEFITIDVEIKTWKELEAKYGISQRHDGAIKCALFFTKEMENNLPDDRIIEVTKTNDVYKWVNPINNHYVGHIANSMIKQYLNTRKTTTVTIKIKSWKELEAKYGLDEFGYINCPLYFTNEMEFDLPDDRIIEVEKEWDNFIWKPVQYNGKYTWKISKEIIEKDL